MTGLTFFHLVKVPVHSACLSHLCQLKNDAVPVEQDGNPYNGPSAIMVKVKPVGQDGQNGPVGQDGQNGPVGPVGQDGQNGPVG